MKKILYVATVAEHFYYFHLPCFKMFNEKGWQVDVACHGDRELPYCDNKFEIPIRRSPADKENLKAYRELKKIIKAGGYDIIHCHTPMGGILARLAARGERKRGTKVIYTAHGFHFYKGAPILNWLIYYPIELVMSGMTDCLITINSEDFAFAKKHLKAKKIVKINGVGCNSDLFYKISAEEKRTLRREKGFDEDETILIYVAEMNANKNQGMLVRVMQRLKQSGEKMRLLIVGADNFNGEYVKLAESLGVADRIDFLGHRNDVSDLVHLSDIAVASSIREGLPVNVMEAMACGLPVVLSDNRGHRELCHNGENGYIVAPNDDEAMAEKIILIASDKELYNRLSDNADELVQPFLKERVLEEEKAVYEEYIKAIPHN